MKIIKINTDHYIVVDENKDIEENCFTYKNGEIIEVSYLMQDNGDRITHSTQPLGFLNEYGSTADLKCDWTNVKFLPISEVKELIGEVDVEKKAEEWFKSQGHNIYNHYNTMPSFIDGYNQCLEDNKEKKYTEEDMKFMFEAGYRKNNLIKSTFEDAIKFIQSLQPKTEWDVEIIDGQLKQTNNGNRQSNTI